MRANGLAISSYGIFKINVHTVKVVKKLQQKKSYFFYGLKLQKTQNLRVTIPAIAYSFCYRYVFYQFVINSLSGFSASSILKCLTVLVSKMGWRSKKYQ